MQIHLNFVFIRIIKKQSKKVANMESPGICDNDNVGWQRISHLKPNKTSTGWLWTKKIINNESIQLKKHRI